MHLAVDYPQLLELGIHGLQAKVAERRQRLDLADWNDLHREQFLKSVDITLLALSEHIQRFPELARQMASQEKRIERR